MTKDSHLTEISRYIAKDPFAKHLGAEVEILAPGHSRVSIAVTEEMANFHGLTHGSVIFGLGDIAFAAASNSHGQVALALNVDITFLKASKPGDRLVAEAAEVHCGARTALYDITIINADTGDLIAKSQDLAYRKKDWFVPPEDP